MGVRPLVGRSANFPRAHSLTAMPPPSRRRFRDWQAELVPPDLGSVCVNQGANLRATPPTAGRKTQIGTLIHANLESQIPRLHTIHVKNYMAPPSKFAVKWDQIGLLRVTFNFFSRQVGPMPRGGRAGRDHHRLPFVPFPARAPFLPSFVS